jgi:hypothetical protein
VNRRRTTAGSDGDAAFSRLADEIPHDEEVAHVLHLLDDADLALEAGFVFVERIAQLAARLQMMDGGVEALLEALAADLLEVAVDGVAIGNGEFRKGIVDLVELEIAALGDLLGALENVRANRERGAPSLRRF